MHKMALMIKYKRLINPHFLMASGASLFELDMSKVKTATKLVDLLTGEEIITGEQVTTVSAPALTGRLLRIE